VKQQPAAPERALAVKQEILAAPQDGVYPQAGKPCLEPGRNLVTQSRRTHQGTDDTLLRQVRKQSLTGHFNFREFWHCCYREKSITCANGL
jgi:hypothetical protein